MRRVLFGSVDFLLVAALLAGLYLTSRASADLSRLRRQHRELVDVVGHLTVEDPEKIHVLRVPSKDPLHWKWRVYIPAGMPLHYVGVSGQIAAAGPRAAASGRHWGSEQASPEPRDMLVEAKIVEENGHARLYFARPGSTSVNSVPREFLPLLSRPDRIATTVAGEGKVRQFAADAPIFLLHMRLDENERGPEPSGDPELAPGVFLAIVPSDVFSRFEQDVEGRGP